MPHRWLDHTGEMELAIEAASPREVFAEALGALGELIGEETAAGEPRIRQVSVSAPDLPTLLVEWLNELVYLSETEDFLSERVLEMRLGERSLEARVAGRPAPPQALVKAATYNRLKLEPENGAWRANVVLDV